MDRTSRALLRRTSRDHRAERRYPIQQPALYKLLHGTELGCVGEGRTVTMASREVLFTTAHPVPVGTPIELTVAWPALLHGSVPMKLVLYGIVQRATGTTAAMSVAAHEFRTARGNRPASLARRDRPYDVLESVVTKETIPWYRGAHGGIIVGRHFPPQRPQIALSLLCVR
jgi:hypothetical protein